MERICPGCGKTHYAATTCPYCGEKVAKAPEDTTKIPVSDNQLNNVNRVKFCPECGHPISDPNAQFCPKCGVGLPVTSTNEPLPIQTATQQQGPTIVVPKEDLSAFKHIAIFLGCIIMIVVFAAIILGSYSYVIHHGGLVGIATSNSQDRTDQIYSQDLSSMALTINDLPTGWMTDGTTIDTKDLYHSNFLQIVGLTPYVVYQDITRNVTIDDAKTAYLSRKGKITKFKVESVDLGDEGFGYISTDSSIVVFREGNIIVTMQYGIGGIGGSFETLSIDDAKNYADIVAGRIQSSAFSVGVASTTSNGGSKLVVTSIPTQSPTPTITGWVYDPNTGGYKKV